MGKYTELDGEVFSVFGSAEWKAEKIKTYPTNFIGMGTQEEFIRITIIPSNLGVNLKSVSGVLLADIFTQAGNGPKRSSTIADKLDSYLSGKTLSTTEGKNVQFYSSGLGPAGLDKDNNALFKITYSIPFNYFEVFT